MTEQLGSPNQWDIFVFWVYGATIVLLGGYAWYLVRLNKQVKQLESEDNP